jgi:hypothetical protein
MTWLLGPIDDFLLGTIDVAELASWLDGVGPPVLDQLAGANIADLKAACCSHEEALALATELYKTAFSDRHLRLAVALAAFDLIDWRRPLGDCCRELEALRAAGASWVSMVFALYNPPPPNVSDAGAALGFSALDLWHSACRSAGIEDAVERRRAMR